MKEIEVSGAFSADIEKLISRRSAKQANRDCEHHFGMINIQFQIIIRVTHNTNLIHLHFWEKSLKQTNRMWQNLSQHFRPLRSRLISTTGGASSETHFHSLTKRILSL